MTKPIPTWRETHADELGPDGGICDSQICLKWAEQEIGALRSENERLKAELDRWLPIETAPKDGTVVLLYGVWAGEVAGPKKNPSIDLGFWKDGTSDYPGDDWWALVTGDTYACWLKATHWMPLPVVPGAKG